MAKIFRFSLKQTPELVLEQAKKAACKHRARFNGDISSGKFSGRGVEGRYCIKDNMVEIIIVRKPFLAPWSLVESSIRQYFL